MIVGGDANRKPDIIFIDRNISLPCPEDGKSCAPDCQNELNYCTVRPIPWNRVRIVGELKKNASKSGPEHRADYKMVLTIAQRVREIFGTQPGRRYVHAFSLCGSLLRCFIFDRSGVVASEDFDIHSNPELTVRIFYAYLYGSPEWTGFDPTIQVADNNENPRTYDPTAQNRGYPFIKFVAEGNMTQLYLDLKPLLLVSTIVSRGTICWRARKAESDKWEFVVKDQWRNQERDHEGVFLQEVKGVEGVAQIMHYENIMIDGKIDDTASAIRRDLDFDSQSVTAVVIPPNAVESLLKGRATGSTSSIATTSVPPPSDPQSNQSSRHSMGLRSKRSCPPGDNQRSQTPKRPRNATLESQVVSAHYNRIHGRLVLHDVGRSLENFETREQLLLALRSGIIGYCNMLQKGIMHGDISVNNIMISNPSSTSNTGGYLIDLDFAVPLSRQYASGAPHRTGTPEFMAIDVLDGEPHVPRHDLESFFYVLIWMYTKYPVPGVGSSESPDPNSCHSQVHSWGSGSYSNMAALKRALSNSKEFVLHYRPWFYEGWRSAPMLALAGEWWSLLFTEPQKSKEQIQREISDGVVTKNQRSQESDVEDAMELANKMIAAVDVTVEALKQQEAGDGKGPETKQ